jgi:hypothetical protein
MTFTDKYQAIRDLTDDDRRDIYEFAMQRSREMLGEEEDNTIWQPLPTSSMQRSENKPG